MAKQLPRKKDVIHSSLQSLRQAVEEQTKATETRPSKKPRELPFLELGIPEEGKKLTLEIRSDSKTLVDWVNGHATLKTRESTVANTQNLLREWWGEESTNDNGLPIGRHIFRGHNKEDDLWAATGVKGREDEWVDTAHSVWSEVTGLCGFGMAGATMEIAVPLLGSRP